MSLPGAGPLSSAARLAAALKSQRTNTAQGLVQTRSARRPLPTAPVPKSNVSGKTDRLTVYANIPVASLTGTSGQYDLQFADWGVQLDESGASIGLGPYSGYDGVFVFASGVYAVNLTLYVPGVYTATNSMMLQLSCNASELNNTPTATWHGDDAISGSTPYASGSLTNFFDGRGLSGGLYPFVIYKNLHASTTQVGINVEVVKLT